MDTPYAILAAGYRDKTLVRRSGRQSGAPGSPRSLMKETFCLPGNAKGSLWPQPAVGPQGAQAGGLPRSSCPLLALPPPSSQLWPGMSIGVP